VIGDQAICAIYRHLKTGLPIRRAAGWPELPGHAEIADLCQRTARAVGGGLLAIDIFESADGLMINEVNHTMEFRNSIATTGVNIPALMVNYVLKQAKKIFLN